MHEVGGETARAHLREHLGIVFRKARACHRGPYPQHEAQPEGADEGGGQADFLFDGRVLPRREIGEGGIAEYLQEAEYGECRHGKFHYYHGGRNCAELAVHRQVVDEEVGDERAVVPPCEEQGEHRGEEQRPFYRAAHVEQPEDKEEAHDGAGIHRPHGHRLVAPVEHDARRVGLDLLLLENLLRLPRAFVEFLETGHRFHAGHVDDARRAAALIAGHEEREGFVDAVAPSGDVAAVEAVGRLFFLHAARRNGEFALAAHGFLGVSVGVVEVRQIGRHAEQSCHECHGRALQEGGQRAAHKGIDAVAKHEETDDEEEIIGHLHVVAQHLESGEECRDGRAAPIFPPHAEHHAADGGRNESEREGFPQVAGRDDDEEIGGKSPHQRTERGRERADAPLFCAHGAQHDVEAEEVEEHETNGGKPIVQPEAVDVLYFFEEVGRTVRRRGLEGGHSAEHGVAPARGFAVVRGAVFSLLLPEADRRQ